MKDSNTRASFYKRSHIRNTQHIASTLNWLDWWMPCTVIIIPSHKRHLAENQWTERISPKPSHIFRSMFNYQCNDTLLFYSNTLRLQSTARAFNRCPEHTKTQHYMATYRDWRTQHPDLQCRPTHGNSNISILHWVHDCFQSRIATLCDSASNQTFLFATRRFCIFIGMYGIPNCTHSINISC